MQEDIPECCSTNVGHVELDHFARTVRFSFGWLLFACLDLEAFLN